jgi:hypothetical protein
LAVQIKFSKRKKIMQHRFGVLEGFGNLPLLGEDAVDQANITALMAPWRAALGADVAPLFKTGTWTFTAVGSNGFARGMYTDSNGRKITGLSEDGYKSTLDVDEVGVFGAETLNALVRFFVGKLPSGYTAAQKNAAYVEAQRAMDSYRKILIPPRTYKSFSEIYGKKMANDPGAPDQGGGTVLEKKEGSGAGILIAVGVALFALMG